MDRWQQFNAIIDSKDLDLKEKGLLLIIFRYYNQEKGYSYPSIKQLKELTQITDDRTLYNIINSLLEKQVLTKETIKGKGCKYYIHTVINTDSTPTVKITDSIPTVINAPTVKITDTPTVKITDTPTVKITVQKEKTIKIKENINIYSEVIDYLNKKIGTNFKPNTPKTKADIKARLKEGFTVDDFKKVIDKKCNQWSNTDYERYLRPQTLFSNKFESYLNEKDKGGNAFNEFNSDNRIYGFDVPNAASRNILT